jgi:hypothetical protein
VVALPLFSGLALAVLKVFAKTTKTKQTASFQESNMSTNKQTNSYRRSDPSFSLNVLATRGNKADRTFKYCHCLPNSLLIGAIANERKAWLANAAATMIT